MIPVLSGVQVWLATGTAQHDPGNGGQDIGFEVGVG